MQKPRIGITPEGIPSIALTAFSAIAFALMDIEFLSFVFLLLTWFSAYFFRDPERIPAYDKELQDRFAVSPADGHIIKIKNQQDPFSGEERTCISIFMNVFSVHVNRSPIKGKIEEIRYFPGKFLNASWDKASSDNERCAYNLKDHEGNNWTFIQIAGLIARRIVCRVESGDNLESGERFGMIKFGSRVDIYLPESYESNVRIGDKVFAGQSLIANKKTTL
ncbi:phosphatidylserine decarboxylase family protein [Desulfovibrio litoralis]|uniref:Phosphatidylserine decarboxylase proenzyme n=1 Tax=Desulfovibrio litoralis DSM 11393 TaxID=1121455 RepID=A0A1M7SQP1_9BACT|nr:phosphatidylserine decarboxylase family protein [Desulfovibrio litoralis]SHN60795.1 phosphatidylserine decarboxylase [Desulfovibrio litoralis DSM 11393]